VVRIRQIIALKDIYIYHHYDIEQDSSRARIDAAVGDVFDVALRLFPKIQDPCNHMRQIPASSTARRSHVNG
jgi:hypothetical protein